MTTVREETEIGEHTTWKTKAVQQSQTVMCGDKVSIQHTLSYNVAEFDFQEAQALSHRLSQLRDICVVDLTRDTFNSLSGHLRVEVYLHEFLIHSKLADNPGGGELNELDEGEKRVALDKLKHFIDVLFFFEKVEEDGERKRAQTFREAVRRWLKILVSLSVCLSVSLSLSLPLSLSLSLSLSHTHTHSLSLFLSLAVCLSLSIPLLLCRCSHTLALPSVFVTSVTNPPHSLSLPPSLSLSTLPTPHTSHHTSDLCFLQTRRVRSSALYNAPPRSMSRCLRMGTFHSISRT